MLRIVIQNALGLLAANSDIRQLAKVFVCRVEHVDDPRLRATISIAASGRLGDRVQPGEESNDGAEVDIDTGLDQLRAHTKDRQSVSETLAQLGKFLLAVSGTHIGAEVDKHIAFNPAPATLEDFARSVFCVDDDKTAIGTRHLVQGKLRHFGVHPTSGFALIANLDSFEVGKQLSYVAHNFMLRRQSDRTFVGRHLVQQRLSGRAEHDRAVAMFNQETDRVVEEVHALDGKSLNFVKH